MYKSNEDEFAIIQFKDNPLELVLLKTGEIVEKRGQTNLMTLIGVPSSVEGFDLYFPQLNFSTRVDSETEIPIFGKLLDFKPQDSSLFLAKELRKVLNTSSDYIDFAKKIGYLDEYLKLTSTSQRLPFLMKNYPSRLGVFYDQNKA